MLMLMESIDVVQSTSIDTPTGADFLNNEPQRTSSATILSSGPPSTKRRRMNEVPEWENTRPQWEQELGDSHAQQQMKDISQVQRPWATVNNPVSTPTPQILGNGLNDGLPRNPMGWAAVNQPTPVPTPQMVDNGMESNSTDSRRSPEQERREETVPSEEGTVPEEGPSALIDRLPKTKQRQVYGLVSGLQGGIEHLQRELDSLKKALGIDDEE
jgi:hypothetical protein